jgi:hypothetical protein
VSPDGAELPDAAARLQLAEQLGVMAVPSIEGALPELLHRLGRGAARAMKRRTTLLPAKEAAAQTQPAVVPRPAAVAMAARAAAAAQATLRAGLCRVSSSAVS